MRNLNYHRDQLAGNLLCSMISNPFLVGDLSMGSIQSLIEFSIRAASSFMEATRPVQEDGDEDKNEIVNDAIVIDGEF